MWFHVVSQRLSCKSDSTQGKSDSTEKNADLRDWYRLGTCLQILNSAGAVSLKLTDIRLHTWRKLFWTGTEREECYWFFFPGHKDPNPAQIYRWGPTGFAGLSRCCSPEPEGKLKSQPKSHPIFFGMPPETEGRAKPSRMEFLFHLLHFDY